MGDQVKRFDPTPYLIKLKGKDYLEVKWRLLGFRLENPNGQLMTEFVPEMSDLTAANPMATFKCTVVADSGATATGYGSEERSDFGDFIEKAETKAIGRALGALGYGTQFGPEHEFGAEDGRVVDSPVERPKTAASNGSASRSTGRTGSRTVVKTGGAPAKNSTESPSGYACEGCKKPIIVRAGSKWTAAEIAEKSIAMSGGILCSKCREARVSGEEQTAS